MRFITSLITFKRIIIVDLVAKLLLFIVSLSLILSLSLFLPLSRSSSISLFLVCTIANGVLSWRMNETKAWRARTLIHSVYRELICVEQSRTIHFDFFSVFPINRQKLQHAENHILFRCCYAIFCK